jgi:hypothetical protein
MSHWLAVYFLHPSTGQGYAWWSGPGSDLGEATLVGVILGGFAGWWHHHNCVEPGCKRLGHPDPLHGHPVCKTHSRHFKEDHGKANSETA